MEEYYLIGFVGTICLMCVVIITRLIIWVFRKEEKSNDFDDDVE